jgi:cytochrome o ubiquinol oxidase subunit 2
LNRADYLVLAKPSEREPVRRYGAVAPYLYDAIVNRCVEPGAVCMSEMMDMDSNRVQEDIEHKERVEKKAALPAAQAATAASASHQHFHKE